MNHKPPTSRIKRKVKQAREYAPHLITKAADYTPKWLRSLGGRVFVFGVFVVIGVLVAGAFGVRIEEGTRGTIETVFWGIVVSTTGKKGLGSVADAIRAAQGNRPRLQPNTQPPLYPRSQQSPYGQTPYGQTPYEHPQHERAFHDYPPQHPPGTDQTPQSQYRGHDANAEDGGYLEDMTMSVESSPGIDQALSSPIMSSRDDPGLHRVGDMPLNPNDFKQTPRKRYEPQGNAWKGLKKN